MLQATNVLLVLCCCIFASFVIQWNRILCDLVSTIIVYYLQFSAQTYILKISASGLYSVEYVYTYVIYWKRKECFYKILLFTQSQNRCTCGNCQVLGRVEACICCQEIEAVQNKLIEAVTSGECQKQPQCITQHPGFHVVCINRWVLQVAWYQYKQQYKAAYDGREDKLFRHIAYRQLTRWCWGILGKEIRVVLPACAVMCIRNFYPPPGPEEAFVFEGFHYADEWLCWPQLSKSILISLENHNSIFCLSLWTWTSNKL